MFTTTLPFVFTTFDKLNEPYRSNKISEISVHQNQIDFLFESGKILYMDSLYKLEDVTNPVKISDITMFNNQLIVSCRDLEPIDKKKKKESSTHPLWLFRQIIEELSKTVCACPALEFVVSDNYIKCYIDKPNIVLSDLIKINKIFDADGILELNGQRAYVLFVRTELPAEVNND